MDLTLPLDHAAIERILPHRYPFLLVDRITEFEVDKRIVGIKNVSFNEKLPVVRDQWSSGDAADDSHRSDRAGRRDHDSREAGKPRGGCRSSRVLNAYAIGVRFILATWWSSKPKCSGCAAAWVVSKARRGLTAKSPCEGTMTFALSQE